VSVRIRLTRLGRRNRPFYRIGAFDNRSRRDGSPIEHLGTYDPINSDEAKQVVLKEERIRYWLSVGAKPSETVASMIKKAGIEIPGKKRRAKKG
jgi:small subunit ribosomal protein S16